MSSPTEVNGRITDAVTQTNVEIAGVAPAQAMATVYQNMAHSIALSIQNATLGQQQWNNANIAAFAQGLSLLFDTAPAAATGSTDLLTGNALADRLAQGEATVATGQQILKTARRTPG